MQSALPQNGFGDKPLRLAILGMVEGNGHPYSWSAIFNGYNRDAMADCPYAGIPQYLFRQPPETLGIPGANVTHIWTDEPQQAADVAKASCIPNILQRPQDCIGQVDAVIIATDKGHEHVARCRPFVEAGLPVFVDKPMADSLKDLRQFVAWVKQGAAIMSSSCIRYAKEFMPYHRSTHELGALRYAGITMAKSWERYGIHALEGIYPILGPGFVSARHSGDENNAIVHLEHQSGVQCVAVVIQDMYGAFGHLTLGGTEDAVSLRFTDTFHAFKSQLEGYVRYLRTGMRPFSFEETIELMKLLLAGIQSRENGGRTIALEEIDV